MLQMCFMDVSRVFHDFLGCFKDATRLFEGALWVFHECSMRG